MIIGQHLAKFAIIFRVFWIPFTATFQNIQELYDIENYVSSLGAVYNKYGSFGGKATDCTALLNLNSSNTSKYSRATDREIDEAISFIKNNKYFSTSNSYDLVKRVIEWGISSSSNTEDKENFLKEILNGYDKDFLKDVLIKYDFKENERNFTGKNGKIICSSDYMRSLEKDAFEDNISNFMFRITSNSYMNLISNCFEEISKQIESDLTTGERQNDYIKSENAEKLKGCIKSLEQIGLRCYTFYSKIDKLDWFVGGNADKILELQKLLNKLNPMDRLLEDGVYGEETANSIYNFMQVFSQGSVPSLMIINPLQTNITGISYINKFANHPKGKKAEILAKELLNGYEYSVFLKNNERIFQLDTPHGNTQFYHMNVNADVPKVLQKYFYDHKEITEQAYLKLKNFENISKKFKYAGKTFLIAGSALDLLEIISAVHQDINDDKAKFAQHTLSATSSIAFSWAGAITSAKVGAMIGAGLGTVTMPVVGTVSGSLILD